MARSRSALHPLVLVSTLALARLAWAGGPEPVPLQALFGKPAVGAMAISPSGRFLAVTVPGKNDRLELRVIDLDQSPWKPRTVAWLKDYDIGWVGWAGESRLVFQAFDSQAADVYGGTRGLWAVDADGEHAKMLVDAEVLGRYGNYEVRLGREVLGGEWELERLLPGDGEDVILREAHWSSVQNTGWFALGRINTRRPKLQRLTTGAPDGAIAWITDDEGAPRYFEAEIGGRRKVFGRDVDGRWAPLLDVADLSDDGWSPRFLLEGTLFVSTQPAGASAAVLAPFDPVTRKLGPPVLAARGFDVGDNVAPLVDEESRRLLGWRYRLDTVYTRWGDERMQRLQAAIDKALPGRVNLLHVRRPGSAKRMLVQSLSDHEPPQYAVLEPTTGRLTPLGSAFPDVPGARMGRRSLVRVKVRDGLEIPVYVTRPPRSVDAAEVPSPAVIYVHGGPFARTGLEWPALPVPQFLASRGYVVLEPDFRGSSGYGLAHLRAGRKQWGRAMQDDLVDALRWAVDQHLVDGGRVCIMGASYGGFAALLGPARDPGVFRCAIAWVAPTDLTRLVEPGSDTTAYEGKISRFLELNVGDPDKEKEQLKAVSPVHRAADLHVPVLAAWGKEDRRVPLANGRRFRDAAQKAGVELEYVEYADEGHSWQQTATWVDFMGRAEKLLARTIGAGP